MLRLIASGCVCVSLALPVTPLPGNTSRRGGRAALLGEIARDHLALARSTMNAFGGLTARLSGPVIVSHLGCGHALQPDVDAVDHDDIGVEHVRARPARHSQRQPVRPKCAPTARERRNRAGSSTADRLASHRRSWRVLGGRTASRDRSHVRCSHPPDHRLTCADLSLRDDYKAVLTGFQSSTIPQLTDFVRFIHQVRQTTS